MAIKENSAILEISKINPDLAICLQRSTDSS